SLIGETGIDIPAAMRRRMLNVYDDAIRYSDAFIKRLREDLAEFDPVFVIHADHGEAFGEHGFYGHLPHPYEEVTHVPLVVANAGGPTRVERPFSLLELPSVIQQIAETGEANIPADACRWGTTKIIRDGEPVTGLRFDDWKYIHDDGTELYHLKKDPKERTDVATSHQRLVDACEEIIQQRQQTDRERQLIRDALVAENGVAL
ncbi:MAG: sulfatase-like hydrolase/transferase, partial [Halobacteriaceae archaeon]